MEIGPSNRLEGSEEPVRILGVRLADATLRENGPLVSGRRREQLPSEPANTNSLRSPAVP